MEQISELGSWDHGAGYSRFSRLANIRRSFFPHPVYSLLQDSLSDLLQQLLTHLCRTAAASQQSFKRLTQEEKRTSGLPEGWDSKPPCRQCLDPGRRPAASYGPVLEASEPQRNRRWSTDTANHKHNHRFRYKHQPVRRKPAGELYSQTPPLPPGAPPPPQSLLQLQMLDPGAQTYLTRDAFCCLLVKLWARWSQTFMMSITARQASSRSAATMTPFPAASPLAFTTRAGKSALSTHFNSWAHTMLHRWTKAVYADGHFHSHTFCLISAPSVSEPRMREAIITSLQNFWQWFFPSCRHFSV